MANSEDMAKMAFGNPGFFDFLKGVGTKVLRGAVKSIPFIGGIASEFIDPVINSVLGSDESDDDLDEEDY